MIAFDSFVQSLPRLASTAALRCLIFAQGEWPAIGQQSGIRSQDNYRGFFFASPLAATRLSPLCFLIGVGSLDFSASFSVPFGLADSGAAGRLAAAPLADFDWAFALASASAAAAAARASTRAFWRASLAAAASAAA